MRWFIIFLCCVLPMTVFASDDCVKSPYNNKTYCCNVREGNLPDGAENKNWGEVIPWNQYWGTVRKCVGGRATNDHFGDPIESVAPNLGGAKIRREASMYEIARYTSFDGTYWDNPGCITESYGSVNFDFNTGGCRFAGLLDVGDKFYKCGEFDNENAERYITEITGKSVWFKNEGDFIKREPNADGFYVVYGCVQSLRGGAWSGTRFCNAADIPTDAELQNGVIDRLNENWLLDDESGNLHALDGYRDGYEYRRDNGVNLWLNCWTRKTAENSTSVLSNKKTETPETKYNYKQCSSDADCTGIDNTKRPYLHSVAWHCAHQTSDIRVCTPTECDDGWHVKQGYGFCEQDAQESDNPPDEITSESDDIRTQSSDIQIILRQKCSEPEYMDANCNCVVPGTWKQGNRCVCTDSNKEIRNGKCEYTAAYINKITSDIESIYNDIKSLTAGFGVSVWHDAEGKFNTARLASDSIAGVVLGTVGGVVTSRLVKKAQVKQGFEDIGCHIGGQSVASYGDEFMVGR